MSGPLVFDPDGYVDMDRFPDDGTDLDPDAADRLRALLLADPVEEPSADEWAQMCSDAVAEEVTDVDEGPFADLNVDAVDDDLAEPPPDVADHDEDAESAGDADDADDLPDDDLPLDDIPVEDLPVDEPFAVGDDGSGGADGLDPGDGLDGLL